VNVPPAAQEGPPEEPGVLDPLKKPPGSVDEAILLLFWVLTVGLAVGLAIRFKLLDRILNGRR